jgi:hypothetical protein
MSDPDGIVVRASDVLILTVPERLTNESKKKFLEWFQGSLTGTSLEVCRVVMLDGGATVQLYRGDDQQTMA